MSLWYLNQDLFSPPSPPTTFIWLSKRETLAIWSSWEYRAPSPFSSQLEGYFPGRDRTFIILQQPPAAKAKFPSNIAEVGAPIFSPAPACGMGVLPGTQCHREYEAPTAPGETSQETQACCPSLPSTQLLKWKCHTENAIVPAPRTGNQRMKLGPTLHHIQKLTPNGPKI